MTMVAEIEEERVAILGVESHMEWRAVCHSHPITEAFIPAWLAPDTHMDWIDAKLDAIEHDALEHPRRYQRREEKSWGEIVGGADPEPEPLLPRNGIRAQHVLR